MENMQRGRFMQQSSYLRQVNRSALDLLEEILRRGKENSCSARRLTPAIFTA
jgi:hypothetical protein